MLSRAKLVILVLGVVFGIPTSYLGFQLKEGMFVKQLINCGEDATNSLTSLYDRAPSSIRPSDLESIGNGLNTCRREADPMIRTVEFVRKEHERNLRETAALK